jgi:hypothetical protein
MNVSKLADWSEIASSVAVVITVIFLTIGVKQNTSALKAQTGQAVLASAQAELGVMMENPEVAVYLSTNDPLTTVEEHIRLNAWFTSIFRSREYSWLQYQSGAIDEAQWGTEVNVIMAILDSSRYRTWWSSLGKNYFGESFVGFVDQKISEVPASDRLWSSITSWSVTESTENLE